MRRCKTGWIRRVKEVSPLSALATALPIPRGGFMDLAKHFHGLRLLLVLLALIPGTAGAECSITLLNAPDNTILMGTSLSYSTTCDSSPYPLVFMGDGTYGNCPGSSYYYYAAPGPYTIRVVNYSDANQTSVVCEASATVTVLPCDLSGCSASVDHIVYNQYAQDVYYKLNVPKANCDRRSYELWVNVSGGNNGCFGGVCKIKLGATPGPYTFKITYNNTTLPSEPFTATFVVFAKALFYTLPVPPNCTTAYQVSFSFTPPPKCLSVGSLTFCADSLSPPTPQGNTTYLFSGHVSLNGMIFSSADATYTGDPSSGSGTFATRGNLFLKRPGEKPLLNGPDLVFDVFGSASVLNLKYLSLNPYYALAPGGVTLTNAEGWLDLANQTLRLPVRLYIGNPADVPLGHLKAILVIPANGTMAFTDTAVIPDVIRDGYEVQGANLAYDEASNVLGGTVDLNFPDLGTWAVRGNLTVESGCINRINVPDFAVKFLSVGSSPYRFDEKLGISLFDICDSTKFRALFYPARVFRSDMAMEEYQLVGVALSYKPSLYFETGNEGELLYRCDTRTTLERGALYLQEDDRSPLAPWYSGNMQTAWDTPDFQWWRGDWKIVGSTGKGMGTFVLDKRFCKGDSRCLASLAIASQWGVSSMPFSAPRTSLYWEKGQAGKTVASFWLPLPHAKVNATVEWPEGDCFNAGAYLDRWRYLPPAAAPSQLLSTPNPLAAPVLVAGGLVRASFAALGGSVLPALALVTPSGQTVTPENYASFPGFGYAADPETRVAVFTILSPAEGTWTLSSNLSPPDVTYLSALTAPDPSVAITSVTRSGESVSVAGSVVPASADTLANVFFSSAPGAVALGTIASALPATSGRIQATWDTTSIPTGSYYVGISVSQDGGFPVEMWSFTPIVIDHGGPAPPTNLLGSRAGNNVSLSWTPSSSPNVAGYIVRYTDAPSVPGYVEWVPAQSLQGTTLSGLDPSQNYRFAVVAIDSTGATSQESNSYTTQSCSVSCNPSAPQSVQKGHMATFAANAFSEFCSGALAYDWDFADGTSHSAQENPTHTYAISGTYAWTLTVSSGGVSSSCTGLTYATETPVCSLTCSATAPSTGKTGQSVVFASAMQKPGCLMAEKYTWNFGDGTTSADVAPSHTYAAPGKFPWLFTVNADGFTCSHSGLVEITGGGGLPGDCDGNGAVSIGEVQKAINMFLGNLAPGCEVDANGDGTVSIDEVQKVINAFLGVTPSVSVSVAPTTASLSPGGTQQFTATVAGTTNTAVTWSVQEGAAGGSVSPAGFYTAPSTAGTYHVKATSQADTSKSASAAVAVTAPPACTLTCEASASAASGTAPLSVSFTATATPTNCSGPVAYAWTFGDGANSTQQNPSHTYTGTGVFNWTMAAGVDGQTCSKSGSVTVTAGGDGTALTLGVPVSGSISGSGQNASWNWYYLDLPTGTQTINVDLTNLSDDVDLYVRTGQKPDLTTYDCRSWNSATGAEHCSVSPAGPVRLWIGVNNYAAGVTIQYTVTASAGGGGACAFEGCSATSLATGLTVTFTSDYHAVNCTGAPAFLWQFGDGAASQQENPVHTYPAPGLYNWTVHLAIEDQVCNFQGDVTVTGR